MIRDRTNINLFIPFEREESSSLRETRSLKQHADTVFDFRYYTCSVPDVNLKSQHEMLFAFGVISRRPEKLLSA